MCSRRGPGVFEALCSACVSDPVHPKSALLSTLDPYVDLVAAEHGWITSRAGGSSIWPFPIAACAIRQAHSFAKEPRSAASVGSPPAMTLLPCHLRAEPQLSAVSHHF